MINWHRFCKAKSDVFTFTFLSHCLYFCFHIIGHRNLKFKMIG